MSLKPTDQEKDDSNQQIDCSSWKPRDWENHLKSIEKRQTECTLPLAHEIEDLSHQDYFEGVVDITTTQHYAGFSKVVAYLMKDLTEYQRFVLNAVFWENRTLQDVADELDVHRSSIQRTKIRAIQTLRAKMIALSNPTQEEEKEIVKEIQL